VILDDLIRIGAQQLEQAGVALGQGTQDTLSEARWLALECLGMPVDSPPRALRRTLTASQVAAVRAMFSRRIDERLPAAYLTGRAWLKGYAFRVDPRVIIPRSFLAELLLRRFSPWISDPDRVETILDVCTGSGCLAVIAADCFAHAHVTATDLSNDALDVARMNVTDAGMNARITLRQGDVLDGLPTGCRFDLIISNPPYVPARKRRGLPPEFRAEPDMALIAADEGMAVVRRLLRQAAGIMNPGGVLAIEIGREKRACERMLRLEFPGLAPEWVRTPEQRDNVFVVRREALINHPWRPPE
jgi:ribosomal protein L3 glutamine methyltransferase